MLGLTQQASGNKSLQMRNDDVPSKNKPKPVESLHGGRVGKEIEFFVAVRKKLEEVQRKQEYVCEMEQLQKDLAMKFRIDNAANFSPSVD